jgi:hypothetical protein
MQAKNEIKIGDYVTDELDYMTTGIVIGKGTLTKLNIPTLKLERPDGKIVYGIEDNAKLIVSKEDMEAVG